jgi:hypothetical protein
MLWQLGILVFGPFCDPCTFHSEEDAPSFEPLYLACPSSEVTGNFIREFILTTRRISVPSWCKKLISRNDCYEFYVNDVIRKPTRKYNFTSEHERLSELAAKSIQMGIIL